MRRHVLSSLLLIIAFCASAQQKRNAAYEAYIERYKDIAIEQMLEHHIPASITLAQGLLESGAGKSSLAVKANNHFGIKCHDWTGARTYRDDDEKDDCFRVYDNARRSFEDHSIFLKKKRYERLFQLSIHDYKGWAKGLKACGYATSNSYAAQLIDIIELYGLQHYDKAKTYDKYLAQHAGANISGNAITHTIYANNRNYYVKAHRGESFKDISKEVGVSYRKLAKYNERDKHDVLSEGDIVYLEKKRTKAEKAFKNQPHMVQVGESMYDISQKYGIRLKYLYKKNKLSPDYMPQVGDLLKVY